jgi:hypothetical protein
MVAKWVPGTLLACLAVLNTPRGAAAAEPALFESRQLTPSGEYTGGVEGSAVDAFRNARYLDEQFNMLLTTLRRQRPAPTASCRKAS